MLEVLFHLQFQRKITKYKIKTKTEKNIHIINWCAKILNKINILYWLGFLHLFTKEKV